MPQIRVAACQLNTVVGDLAGNVGRSWSALARGGCGADLAVFPELAVPATRPRTCSAARVRGRQPGRAGRWPPATGQRCAAVVGYVEGRLRGPGLPTPPPSAPGPGARSYRKRLLPNYGVFDEQRYFVPGRRARAPLRCWRGAGRGLDLRGRVDRRRPDGRQAAAGAGRCGQHQRLALLTGPPGRAPGRAGRAGGRGRLRPRLRQPGGRSGRAGVRRRLPRGRRRRRLLAAGRPVRRGVLVVDLDVAARPAGPGSTARRRRRRRPCRATRPADAPAPAAPVADPLDPVAEVYEALVLGTRDYWARTGSPRGDRPVRRHRLVAGGRRRRRRPRRRHVHGVSMPSRYSSEGYRTTPRRWPRRLGIDLHRARSRRPTPPSPTCSPRCSAAEPVGSDRREPAVAHPRRAPHGPLQRHGAGSCSPPATRARWPPATPRSTATRPAGSPSSRTCPRPSSTSCAGTATPGPGRGSPADPRGRARQAAVGRAAARPARRRVAAALRRARPGPRGYVEDDRTAGRPGGRGLRPGRGATAWWGWSTGPSTSGARCPPACASPPRPSARTGACPSPTTTGPGAAGGAAAGARPWLSRGGSAGRRRLPRGVAPLDARPRWSATTGGWSDASSAARRLGGRPPPAGVQVHLDAAERATPGTPSCLGERLPVLDGVDPDALTGRPGHRRAPWPPSTGLEAGTAAGWTPRGAAPAGRPLPGGAAPAGGHLRPPPPGRAPVADAPGAPRPAARAARRGGGLAGRRTARRAPGPPAPRRGGRPRRSSPARVGGRRRRGPAGWSAWPGGVRPGTDGGRTGPPAASPGRLTVR